MIGYVILYAMIIEKLVEIQLNISLFTIIESSRFTNGYITYYHTFYWKIWFLKSEKYNVMAQFEFDN